MNPTEWLKDRVNKRLCQQFGPLDVEVEYKGFDSDNAYVVVKFQRLVFSVPAFTQRLYAEPETYTRFIVDNVATHLVQHLTDDDIWKPEVGSIPTPELEELYRPYGLEALVQSARDLDSWLVEDEAFQRAENLLLNNLNDTQRSSYLNDRTFLVVGNVTGKHYRVLPERAFNVLDVAKRHTLCITTTEMVPVPDIQLVVKTMIEADENKFLEIAIRWQT